MSLRSLDWAPVSAVRAHPIAIADPPVFSSFGLHPRYAMRTIVEVVVDDQVIGLAETPGAEVANAIEREGARLIGRDIFNYAAALPRRTDFRGDMTQTMVTPGQNPADEALRIRSALEIACLDAQARLVGRPLCDILGGPLRQSVNFSAYLFFKLAGGGGIGKDERDDIYGPASEPQEIVAQAIQMVDAFGFKELKLKAGVLEPAVEVETLRALRETFPLAPLRLDPNSVWRIETALEIARQVEDILGVGGYLEDPVAELTVMESLSASLRAEGIEVPLASNMCVTNLRDAYRAASGQAVQIVLSDPHYWGGLREQQTLASFCESAEIGLSMHSNSHLGVSLMTMVHAAAVSPQLEYACDTHYPWQYDDDEVIVGGRIKITDGAVAVPTGAGLGVDLDYDQLARLKERYSSFRNEPRDQGSEMRRVVDADWQRDVTRW